MNLGVMRSTAAAELGLDNSASSVEQGLVDNWCNEAVMDFLQKSRVVTTPRTFTIGVADKYQLPATSMAVRDIEVTSSGIVRPLDHVSTQEIITARRIPGSGVTRMWADEGDYILLYPSSTASESFTFYEVLKPTRLSTSSDDPANTSFGLIPEQFHHILMQFVFWKAAAYSDHQASNRGLSYRDVYLQEVSGVGRFNQEPPNPLEALAAK